VLPVGHGPQPLTAARTLGHRLRRRRRRLRICLLELPSLGPPIATEHAFWIGQRSRACSATVNRGAAGADVVWVLTQDPLVSEGRRVLEAVLARLPARVAVLNPPRVHDAYHEEDAFARLAAAGVSVPQTAFGPSDLGLPVVFKAAGEQPARKFLAPWRGPVPGYRPFLYEDGRDPNGLWWRYRAYYVAGEVLSGDAVGSPAWEARAERSREVDLAPELRPAERAQIARLARTLELDFFAVDYLRRAGDGTPVFLDVNVYPMVSIARSVTGERGLRGSWHVWEIAERYGAPDPDRSHWERFDAAMLAVAASTRAS